MAAALSPSAHRPDPRRRRRRPGHPYVVMELVDRPTVDQVGPLTVRRCCASAREVPPHCPPPTRSGWSHRDIQTRQHHHHRRRRQGRRLRHRRPGSRRRPGRAGSTAGHPGLRRPERLTREASSRPPMCYSPRRPALPAARRSPAWTAESTEQMLTDQVYVEPAPLPAGPAWRPHRRPVHGLPARSRRPAPRHSSRTCSPQPPSLRSRARGTRQAAAQTAPCGRNGRGRGGRRPGRRQVAPTGSAPWRRRGHTAVGADPGSRRHGRTRASPAGSTAPTSRRRSHRPRDPSATASCPGRVPDGQARRHRSAPTPASRFGHAAPPPPAPSQQSSTFTSEAGTVTAVCTPTDLAELRSWQPIRPYSLGPVRPGPADAATADFLRGKDTVRMTVTCADGRPSHTVTASRDKPPPPAGH